MAIYPSQITIKKLHEIVESEMFVRFHNSMKSELDIEDIQYGFLLCSSLSEQDGYPDPYNRAKTYFADEWTKVEKVALSGDGIKNLIESKFSKIYGNAFNRVVELVLLYALVHELVHVQQFKVGKITKDKMKEIEQIPYNQREIELEADSIAKQVIDRGSNFDRRIISILLSNESIHSGNLNEIMELYEGVKCDK